MLLEGIAGHPLTWPVDWSRTKPNKRERSRYQVSFGTARDGVLHSLDLMGARPQNVVISTNIPLRRDGLPYAGFREPDDPGVAVYWSKREIRDGQRVEVPHVIACDAWLKVRDNLRAVGLTLEGLRAIERSKATQILERAYAGFIALPSATKRSWREVLCLHGRVTREDVERAFRDMSRNAHPDVGGSHEQQVELGNARVEALREVI